MFSHGKRTAKPCTNNAAPCNAEDLFRESSGKRTMRRHSDRTVQPICFSSVRFYRLLLISNPSTVHAGEGPTRTQNLKPRVENYAEGRLPGLKTPMRSQEQHPCLHFKVPPTNKFPRNKKAMNGTSSCCSYHNPSTQAVFTTALFQLTLLSTIELSVKEKQAL